jgi:hypothetical protein
VKFPKKDKNITYEFGNLNVTQAACSGVLLEKHIPPDHETYSYILLRNQTLDSLSLS